MERRSFLGTIAAWCASVFVPGKAKPKPEKFFEVWSYPEGNEQAKAELFARVKGRAGLVLIVMQPTNGPFYGVRRINWEDASEEFQVNPDEVRSRARAEELLTLRYTAAT